MTENHWNRCAQSLQLELSEQQFNTWIRPLKSQYIGDELHLLAPNRFIRNWVEEKFLSKIRSISTEQLNLNNVSGQSITPKAIVVGLLENYAFPPSSASSVSTVTEIPTVADEKENQNKKEQLKNRDERLSKSFEVGQQKINHSHNIESHVDNQPVNPAQTIDFNFLGKVSKEDQEANQDNGPALSEQPSSINLDSINPSPMGSGNFALNESQSFTEDRQRDQQNPRFHQDSALISNHRFSSIENKDSTYSGAQSKRPSAPPALTSNKGSALNDLFTFDSFVEGKSNQIALAATKQVADNPGSGYNPLFIYGGVGLGKTHLMHAVGNSLRQRNPNARVVYLHSERFVADMVKALQLNAINDFKRYYRTVDALLIDDIQFFAHKDRSQEEFFHTFNALMEGGQQMIFTCDRYPKEINGLEERLKSRFGWGLTVAVEPPELETRAAILMKKAEQINIPLSHESAIFIAQRVRSNVRELEGALKRVVASAHFTGRPITVDLIKESLKDLLALQQRLVTIENIQKMVAEYYKIKLSDLLSKKRTRSLARPRQLAMSLAKELTNHSLPEIGDAFGGRDHTTVLHACRKIRELESSSSDLREDIKNLNRILST